MTAFETAARKVRSGANARSEARSLVAQMSVDEKLGDRTNKLSSGTTSERGRYVKSVGDPVTGSGYSRTLGEWGQLP